MRIRTVFFCNFFPKNNALFISIIFYRVFTLITSAEIQYLQNDILLLKSNFKTLHVYIISYRRENNDKHCDHGRPQRGAEGAVPLPPFSHMVPI